MFRSKREPSRIPAYLVLAILGLFAVGPIALLALNSLKTTNEIRANPFGLPPNWLFSNYVEAWVQGAFTTTLINTSILTGSTICNFFALLFLERSTMAAYSVWVHERSVEATPVGCVLRDRVSFVLRRPLRWLPGLVHVHQAVVTRIFRHRHRRLVDRFGGQSALAGPPT